MLSYALMSPKDDTQQGSGSPERRFGFPFRRNETPSSSFEVRAEGASTLYRWIQLKHKMAGAEDALRVSLGNGNDSNEIQLGVLHTDDNVLDGITTRAMYDDDDLTYSIGTAFIFKNPEVINRNSTPFEMLQAMERIGRGEIRFGFDFDKDAFYSELRRILGNNDFEYNLDPHGGSLRITAKNESAHHSFRVGLRENALNAPELIFLLLEGDAAEESEDAFRQRYEAYAQMVKNITDGLYSTKRESPPEGFYKLEPPKNTQAILDTAIRNLKTRRKMLSNAGVVDGDEDLMEEIEAKIVLEKRPGVTFDDIGGNERAKQELLSVVHALKDPEAYRRWGTSAPRGVLLYGEPGTGKTLLAKALANKAEAGIYVVNTADVLHSLYGRTERLVQAIFDKARQNAPVVILFDELDALAGSRERSTEVTSRIVSVLLTNMDGLEERDNGIVVVGTTNMLNSIDPALKRPGRFDLIVEVPMPDQAQREQIFGIHKQNAEKRSGGRQLFDPGLDLSKFIQKTDQFSGADIEEIIRRTLAGKVRQEERNQVPGPVTTQDILDTISVYENIRKARKATMGFQPPKNGS